jgi:hypothetical protein
MPLGPGAMAWLADFGLRVGRRRFVGISSWLSSDEEVAGEDWLTEGPERFSAASFAFL